MDSGGNLYASGALAEALENDGRPLPVQTRVVSEQKLERISAKPGTQALSEDELRTLARLPRRERRIALANLRRNGRRG